jgi:hypothetical protein
MTLRLTPRPPAEAKRIKTWWRGHRLAAPDLEGQQRKGDRDEDPGEEG